MSQSDENTDSTYYADDNKLGISDKNEINRLEAEGFVNAYIFIGELEIEQISLDIYLLLDIHKIAFEKLYDWAGKFREREVSVSSISLTSYPKIREEMYRLCEDINAHISYCLQLKEDLKKEEALRLLSDAHHRFVCIHPFTNGNGRMGRIFINLIAIKLNLNFFDLYDENLDRQEESSSKKKYIQALRAYDIGERELFLDLLRKEYQSFSL